MLKFAFHFIYEGSDYEAECLAFPLDGTTDLHITPHDTILFDRFGVRIFTQASDGIISTGLSAKSEERNYLLALAEGISAYFDDEQKTIYQ
jgi:hypothetical protein